MSAHILELLAAREQAWQKTAVAAAPATATKSASLRGQAEKLSAQANEIEAAAVAAANELEILFQQRGDLQRTAEFLARLSADVGNIETFANGALRELVLASPTGDKFGLARFESAAASIARLQVVAPVLPGFKAKNDTALVEVEKQIRATAKEHGVNLPALIRELQAGGTQISAWTD